MVRSGAESQEVRKYVADCERRAEFAGITAVTYRTGTRLVHTRKGTKKRAVLQPNDAYRLYDQLHYSPVLVCLFSSAFVSRDPGRTHPRETALISIEDFVRHKAAYTLLRGDADVAKAFDSFAIWRAGVHCDDENDPRALPLHMFATNCDCSRLGTTEGDKVFRDRHGRPGSRTDDERRTWNRADRGAYHGGPALRVACRELHAGMHWDVSSRRSEAKLQNSIEVWRLYGSRSSYANVFPNAHILVPAKSTAKKVWPFKAVSLLPKENAPI